MTPGSGRRRWLACALAAASLTAAGAGARAGPVQADAATPGWNSERALELARRAVRRRADRTSGDSLRDYQARARGHVYFLFDRGRGTPRHVVKADQVAIDLFWAAPGRTRQVIVGHREEETLPTRIRYHIDHLTVVMDNFGDSIRLGEGTEVRDALHPAAPGAPTFYDYRLADSLTLVMPGRDVRVYKLDVRPRDPTAAGIVGAFYLDRGSADIVRMDFTFTAASYLDPQLDYINIRLENGLWDGRYWLPYRQSLELRRQLRVLEFPAGGVIRADFSIGGYRLNADLPDELFRGPPIAFVPPRARSRFRFEDELYSALDPSTRQTPLSLEEIRDEAEGMIAGSYLRRMAGLRMAVPGLSSIARFRRAEGLYVGPGLGRRFADVDLRVLGGRAFGSDRWEGRVRVSAELGSRLALEIEGYRDGVAEMAPWPVASGLVSSLAALFDGEDYGEPYWTSGARLSVGRSFGPVRSRATLAWESWESAGLGADAIIDRGYRPVRTLGEGHVLSLALSAERPPPAAVEATGGLMWAAELELSARAAASDFEYVRSALRAEHLWAPASGGQGFRLSAAAGAVAGGAVPAQKLFPLGGRGTVRGYPFHRFAGDLYGTLSAEVHREVWRPWLTVAVFGDLGWTEIQGGAAERAVDGWLDQGIPVGPTRGVAVGAGVGVGLLFDMLRIELARGLEGDGIWELIVRTRSRFWGWL